MRQPPIPLSFKVTSLLRIRFMLKVRKTKSCWLWTGKAQVHQRGDDVRARIRIENSLYLVHRVAYLLATGKSPGDSLVLHTCDNTLCVNPNHLFLGTDKDNSDDKRRKGRQMKPVGEKNPRAKLTNEQVIYVRKKYNKYIRNGAALARKLKVRPNQVYRIAHRHQWSHL